MIGVIFRQALREARRASVGCGLGMAGLAGLVILFFALSDDPVALLRHVLSSPLIVDMFGDMTVNLAVFASPEGFLGMAFSTYGPLLVGVYAVLGGLVNWATVPGAQRHTANIDFAADGPAPVARL